jgi:hypothetical protein
MAWWQKHGLTYFAKARWIILIVALENWMGFDAG